MDTLNIKNEIDGLIESGNKFAGEIEKLQASVATDLSRGGIKTQIINKLNESAFNAKHIVSTLAELKNAVASGTKKIKESKRPKDAIDVWALLK